MGGVSDFVGNAVGSGLNMVSGGLATPIMGKLGLGGGGGSPWGATVSAQQSAAQAPVPQQTMPAAYNNPWIQQFIAQQRAGGQGQGGMPMGMNVTPLAMRQQQPQIPQPMAAPTWNQNNFNPYQNYMMRQQQAQPTPYQNMGMFGAYNPYMPKR